MNEYTLWAFAESLGGEALLVAERPGGDMEEAFLAEDASGVRTFIAARGWPRQITANGAAAVRIVRQAEPRLFQVPATLLKPKELLGPLLRLVLRAYRRPPGA